MRHLERGILQVAALKLEDRLVILGRLLILRLLGSCGALGLLVFVFGHFLYLD